jgi:uroporphyrinogen decarboxylase
MTSRERVAATLNFEPVDRISRDLSGMRSTGISCFAYPGLVEVLGLPYRKPLVYDLGQMLALPEIDVLDALDCDVVALEIDNDLCLTNAFAEANRWSDYDFNSRLPARVLSTQNNFKLLGDGTIVQTDWNISMVSRSYVFDADHGGQSIDFSAELPLLDLSEYRVQMQGQLLTDDQIRAITAYVRRTREATDRAILVAGSTMMTQLGIGAHGGLGVFPMICMTEPDYVHEYHSISTEVITKNIEMLLPEIAADVDIVLTGGGDWGTQETTFGSPKLFKNLFAPYMRELNDAVHRTDGRLKTFIHSCGAVYELLDSFIDDCSIDVINPVQWTAGGRGYKAWKDKVRGRATLWGGGMDAQKTLPFGSVDEVEALAEEVGEYYAEDGGFVFANIHNILAEIPAEKVVAMFDAARGIGPGN